MTTLNLTKNHLNSDGNIKEEFITNRLNVININIPDLEKLPSNLPDSLMDFSLKNCSKIKKLPDKWPKNLTSLDLTNSGVEEIPDDLPDSIRSLNLAGTKITKFPKNYQET